MSRTESVSETDEPSAVKTYREYTDDFVESRDQNLKLPEGYTWLHKNIFYRLGAAILYKAALLYTFFYTRFILHIRVENRQVFKKCRDGGFIMYGNHTQPIGDAFAPARYIFPKRLYTVVSPSNLGIPVLGKFLPMLGALPIPETFSGMKEFLRAIRYHLQQGCCVLVYPEAHVWPWCTFVRPFPDTAFQYPVMFQVPAFCMTTTYQKPRHGKKPYITVYLDGPFYPEQGVSRKQAQKKLYEEISACMHRRSENSTCEYIRYVKEEEI